MRPLLVYSLWRPGLVAGERQGDLQGSECRDSDRVRDLLSKMTIDKKVAQLESGWTLPAFGSFKMPSVIDKDHVNET